MSLLTLRGGQSALHRSKGQPCCPQPPNHPRFAGECSTSYSCGFSTRRHMGRATRPVTCRAAPWTKEDLEQMNNEVEKQEEAGLGEAWRGEFAGNLEALHEYPQNATYQWIQVVESLMKLPKPEWEDKGLYDAISTVPPAMANDMIGMGTWRLKGEVDPAIEYLVSRIEGSWREVCSEDLTIYPPDEWKGMYDICDSMDPARELDGWSYSDMPNPEEGAQGYPRLLLENRIYSSRVFRKLHLEVGLRQDGLQVLHAVLYPRYAIDLPILAMDLVVAKGVVTLAIIDACPVRKNKYLPPHYLQTMHDLQAQYLTDADNARRVPEWGQNIFSPACVCIRPTSADDVAGFLRYAVALHRAHMMLSTLLTPVQPETARDVARLAELAEGHRLFVENQLANKKTTRVLEAAFGKEWADEYMTHIMFDYQPGHEPKVMEDQMGMLYDYFDKNPELGSQPAEIQELLDEVAIKRAEEFLNALVEGQQVRKDKVEWSLQTLYDRDPMFRQNVCLLIPGLEQLEAQTNGVGRYLADNLAQLGLQAQEGWVKEDVQEDS